MFIYKLLLLFQLYFKTLTSDIPLVINYMNYKFLKSCIIFNCLDKKGQLDLAKELTRQSIKFHVIDINNFCKIDRIKNFTHHYAIIFDITCNYAQQCLHSFDDETYFDDRKHWLMIDNGTNLDKFDILPLNINADVHIAVHNGLDLWHIFDLYNPAYKHGGQNQFKSIGHFNKKGGYKVNESKEIYFSRRNLTGVQFKLITVLTYPAQGNIEEYLVSENYLKVDIINRACYIILRHSMEFYNFTMPFNITRSWGYHLMFNKTFDGLVGVLQRKEADFGSGLYLNPDRLEMIDYGARMWIVRNAFILRRVPENTSFLTFLKPLSTCVWYLVIVSVIVLVVALKGFVQTEWAILKNKYKYNDISCENTWSFLMLLILGSLCQQGTSEVPYFHCGRILVATIFLYSILLFQMYSASIVSSLLITPKSTIRSLEDLLTSDISIAVENVLYTKDFLQKSTYPVIKELERKKIKNNFINPEDGLRRVATTKCAYHVELSTAYPIIESTFSNTQVCELQEIRMIQDAGIFVTFQKSSPFKDLINFGIRRIEETGLHKRLISRRLVSKPVCFEEPNRAASVGLMEFLPVLVVLMFGIGLSLIILLIERLQWNTTLFNTYKNKFQK